MMRTFRIPKDNWQLRVPPLILKSIGFVAEIVGSDMTAEDALLIGTAFIVSLPYKTWKGVYRHYFVVTARHVFVAKPNTKFVVLVNKNGGGIEAVEVPMWFTLLDPNVDVSVGLFPYRAHMDISTFGLEDALDDKNREPFGVGDEVFFPGLFHLAPGIDAPGINQVVPIVRHGNVAMMPTSEIQVKGAFSHIYLIEARSIGGLSGSPVWVRETIALPATRNSDGKGVEVKGVGSMKLMGLIQGHWNVHPDDVDDVNFRSPRRGVNAGIAIVTPACKIIEILNAPELQKIMLDVEEMVLRENSPVSDKL